MDDPSDAIERVEAALRKTQAVAGIGSYTWSLSEAEPEWSDQMYAIFGLELGSPVSNEDFLAMVHEDDKDTVRDAYAKTFSGEPPLSITYRVRSADGAIRHLLATAELVRNAMGEPTRLFGTTRDITERVELEARRDELEEQLQEARKLESLGILAGGMAHEFNNLLTATLANAELTRMDLPPGSAMRESVEEIVVATRRAAELARQMLAYSGHGKFAITAIDLSNLVSEMEQRLRATLASTIALRLELASGTGGFDGDATQLREVVASVVANAAEALDDTSGTITVRTGQQTYNAAQLERLNQATGPQDEPPEPGPYVFVEVADTGCGMNTDTRARLFEPFFSTKFPGRGLGMSGVLSVVRSHRGAIGVQSAVGRGTTLRLLFPVNVAETEQPAKPERAPTEARATVLLIDDEASILRTGKRMLNRIGFEALCAVEGATGLSIFRERVGEIAAVMVDLSMPDVDGEEVVRGIREIDDTVSILVCTGYDLEETSSRFEDVHVDAFIQKPYTTATLLRHLQPLLKA